MSTTLQEISQFLTEEGIRHQVMDEMDVVTTGFVTDHYLNTDGRKHLKLVVDLSEDGEFVKVEAPFVYRSVKGQHRGKLHRALSSISYRTKMIRYEHDERDGEIRASIHIPLEDAPLTRRQLCRAVRGVVSLVDRFDSMVRKAIEKGVIEFPEQRRRPAPFAPDLEDFDPGLLDLGDLGDLDPAEVALAGMDEREEVERDPVDPPSAG